MRGVAMELIACTLEEVIDWHSHPIVIGRVRQCESAADWIRSHRRGT